MSLQGYNEQNSAKQKNKNNDHISAKQKNTLMHKNIKIYREQVIKEEIIDLERARTERKLNQEAKSLIKTLKFPAMVDDGSQSRSKPPSLKLSSNVPQLSFITPQSPSPRRGSLRIISELTTNSKPNKDGEIPAISSPSSLPPSPLLARKNLGKDFQLSTGSPRLTRRGSMNDIQLPMASPLPMPRRGSMGELPSSILQRRRSNFPPLSPLCDKPLSEFTKCLSKRVQFRRTKNGSGESPPDSPRMSSLEEQFKSLESCRYLRHRGSQEDQQSDLNDDHKANC